MYRAEHVRLGREVAVKVLHELTSDNPEYKSRFEREARVLASLNHPNIATLHGLEEVGDSTLLEMELVPGETLAERIDRGAMPPSETLPIFKQIAQALEAAHERGIIHRDLKPSNVKVTPEGRVKVLDFGLAKAFESERQESSSNAAMFTTTTQKGLILGTAAYMSPEHVRGKTLDRRTDIWAFGCMFYEAITGKPPFASETVSDTLAAVLREEPDWRGLSHAPMAVQRLIKRCLKKDPTARLHDIADAGLEIEDAVAESAPLVVQMPGVDPWRVSRKRAAVTAAVALDDACRAHSPRVLAGRPHASASVRDRVPRGPARSRGSTGGTRRRRLPSRATACAWSMWRCRVKAARSSSCVRSIGSGPRRSRARRAPARRSSLPTESGWASTPTVPCSGCRSTAAGRSRSATRRPSGARRGATTTRSCSPRRRRREACGAYRSAVRRRNA